MEFISRKKHTPPPRGGEGKSAVSGPYGTSFRNVTP